MPQRKSATTARAASAAAAQKTTTTTAALKAAAPTGKAAAAKAAAAKAAAKAQGRKFAPRAELEGTAAPPAANGTTPPPADTDTAAAKPGQIITAPVTFRGRRMRVRAPGVEALAVMQRLGIRFNALDGEQLSMETALRLMGRGIDTIAAVLVDQDDKDWLEEQFLDGMTMEEAVPLMRQAIDAIRANPANRAERRAAAPAKARRTT